VGTAYKVPYRLTLTNHYLVRVKVNGKGPFNFLVDTGAPYLFVSTEAAKKVLSSSSIWALRSDGRINARNPAMRLRSMSLLS